MLTLTILLAPVAAPPAYLEDRFDMPAGFRIYKAASADLSGASFDLCLDASGRLLVGDGSRVRRLTDADGDGVYDAAEVIAEGLGPRGPQGLCLWGDRLYAVGGDGVQVFEGYGAGKLVHRGRLGARFSTGGDHDAHTVFRGPDDWLYFITGDGGGARDRRHITEPTSPALFERACSVFRFSADGSRWECVGSGGRNAPNLGMNYLGELFSLDSDMEWHVELPWWRPVRLNHWVQGGDQGWQDVGAFPPYYMDCLAGIGDVGRGSPDWGVFYEHTQLPSRYRDAYLVCDYLSKSATTGGYETTGRLFAFFLQRRGAGWKATWETLARPKPGAKDDSGGLISFAIVDIEVAHDGSLLLSDHNQGVWRILYSAAPAAAAPPLTPAPPPAPPSAAAAAAALVAMPQPSSELVQALKGEWRKRFPALAGELAGLARSPARPARERLSALRHLACESDEVLTPELLAALARDDELEVRALAAWILGLEPRLPGRSEPLRALLADPEPFVRRRALEAVTRLDGAAFLDEVVAALEDPDRLVRYTAMIALSHWPTSVIVDRALPANRRNTSMRALVAADLRREPAPDEVIRRVVAEVLDAATSRDAAQDRLDLLRVLGRFERSLKSDPEIAGRIASHLVAAFPSSDRDIAREEARLLGEYGVAAGFDKLAVALAGEKDQVTQFHLAQAISRIPRGWSPGAEEQVVRWLLEAQRGWFSEPAGKGLQFPHFWLTVLAELADRHASALYRRLGEIDLASQLGAAVIDRMAREPDGEARLVAIARARSEPRGRRRALAALAETRGQRAADFLREEYLRSGDTDTRAVALRALARQEPAAATVPLLLEGLAHPDRETARACLQALASHPLEPTQEVARAMVAAMAARPELFRGADRLLAKLSGVPRTEGRGDGERERRPDEAERQQGIAHWRRWYAQRFGAEYDAGGPGAARERDDGEVHALLASAAGWQGGDAERGKAVYTGLRCDSCHGVPGATGGQIFGPELGGVARRLTRLELADALVYPSKQVADRFKATLVQTADGTPRTGFITERSADALVLVDQERAHRLAAADILLEEKLDASLMPERLLSRLADQEIRDLAAFLAGLGTGAAESAAVPGDWPQWRGPGARGVAAGPAPPDRWSEMENVLWTSPVPSWGNSSPAVAADRVYVTSQAADDALVVTALDRATGSALWSKEVGKGRRKAHEIHNMATPSPAASGDKVWALFGTGDLVALDASGAEMWRRNLAQEHGDYRILWGMGSSPILHGGRLYTVCIHPGPSYVLAIDPATGKDVWKADRALPCADEATDSYSSPVVVEHPDRVELVVGGCDHLTAYEPATGAELWRSSGLKIDHPYGRTMASPGAGGGVVVGASASVKSLGKVVAVRSGGAGDVSETHRLWQYDKFTPDCPSPLVHDGHVYVVRDDGIGSCLDARTGELRWRKRLGRGNFKASPVACGDRVYFLGEQGECIVVRAGGGEDVVAENNLDGHFIATPAIAGGVIYLRARDRVVAIGRKTP